MFHGRCGVSSRFHSAFLSSLSLSRSRHWICSARKSRSACLPLSVLDTVSPPILMIPQSLSLFVCLCLSLCHHLCAYASLSLTVSILSPLLFLRALPPDSPFLLVAHSTSARLDPLTLALDDHRSTGSRVDLCVPKKSSRLFNI